MLQRCCPESMLGCEGFVVLFYLVIEAASMAQCVSSMLLNGDLQAKQELRAITAADFEAARQQVTPSTNPDSMVISELKQWNATYGESGNKAYRQHLSYFT